MCTKFQVKSSETVTGRLRHIDGQTYRGPKQGKAGRNQNTSPGPVVVSKQYQFVKQCWLVNIIGLYRVQVSGKVPVSPSAFQHNVNYQIWHCESIFISTQ